MNRKAKSETLGGEYKAPMTGFSEYIGEIDLDENLGMTVLSQSKIEKMGGVLKRKDKEYILTLPGCPISISFSWVEGIMAGNFKEFVEYYTSTNDKKRSYASWTSQDTDEPSDLLSNYKMIPDMSNSDIRRLDKVHRALKTLWSPSKKDLITRITNGTLVDVEFDEKDVNRYFDVFDYDLGALKGKAEDQGHDIVKTKDLYNLNKDEVILYCDIYYICGIPFLITVDSLHSLVTSTCLKSRESNEIMRAIKHVASFYLTRDIIVKVLEFDKEPGVSSEDVYNLLGINLMPRSTHVSHAEVNIKVIKQRVRTALAGLAYKPTKTMLIEIVIAATMISCSISRDKMEGSCPQQSFYGSTQSFKKQFAFCPSDYVEVHCLSDNNVLHRRTTSAIPMHVSPNNPNEWVFYSLETGKTFVRPFDDAYLMPMTKSIVDRIAYLGVQDPIIGDTDLAIIGTDTSYVPKYLQPAHVRRGRPKLIHTTLTQKEDISELNDATDNLAEEFLESYFGSDDWGLDEQWTPPDDEPDPFEVSNEANTGELLFVKSSGGCVYLTTAKDDRNMCFSSHMSATESKKQFGVSMTLDSIKSEINGLMKRGAMVPVDQNEFNWKANKVIPMSLFLKDKIDIEDGSLIKLKARLVAGGHRQDRALYPASRRSSPTANIQSIFAILSIAASESRRVMTFDVGMAFLEADMDEDLYMMLDKDTTSAILSIHPEFGELVRSGKLLVKLMKALYGCVQSSKLWYDRITCFLLSIGFSINPLDQCVFNRISAFDGSQCTIGLHVDDGLVTCVNEDELKLLEKQLSAEFEIEILMGPAIKYLGMKIDFTEDTCKLTMRNYIEELLKDSKITSLANSPAAHSLFDIDEASERLDSERSEKFHSIVASLLYLATRTRPDILLPVVFLCSRVGTSTKSDDKKLMRVLSYLNATIDLPFILGRKDDPVVLNCYADASFAVHKDFKSHGSILMSCGHGFIWAKCGKQKLVTKSSTEAELVTLSDAVSMTAWAIQFLKGQGYNVKANLFQDNLSTIALANNGRSTSDRTRHINIRYFFIKQYIEDGSMIVEHCPATDMIADILTKPLQGYEFTKLRDLLMGHNRDEFPMKNCGV